MIVSSWGNNLFAETKVCSLIYDWYISKYQHWYSILIYNCFSVFLLYTLITTIKLNIALIPKCHSSTNKENFVLTERITKAFLRTAPPSTTKSRESVETFETSPKYYKAFQTGISKLEHININAEQNLRHILQLRATHLK